MHVNELLTYATHFMHNSALDNTKKIIEFFYSSEEINYAKKALWDVATDDIGPLVKRNNTCRRTTSVANINDIFDALIKLDSLSKLPKFVAVNLSRVPDRQPEELNLLYIIDRVSNIEKKLKLHEETLTTHKTDMLNMNDANENLKSKIFDIDKKINDNRMVCNNTCNMVEINHDNTNDVLNINDTIQTSNSFDALSSLFHEEIATPGMVKKHIEKFNNEKTLNNYNESKEKPDEKPDENNSIKTDEEDYIPVESKANRQRRISQERMKRAIAELQGAPPPVRNIFVSRVSQGNDRIVIDYLKSKSIKVLNIDCISHHKSKFKSFKVSIYKNDIEQVLNENFWPTGIHCKLWREFTSNSIDGKTYDNAKPFNVKMYDRRESNGRKELKFYNKNFLNKKF